MLLTKAQQHRFWREWSQVKTSLTAKGLTPADIESERHALISRAGFESLTLVDHLTGFDRLLAELALITQPSNLEPQLREKQMPRKRLYFRIEQLSRKMFGGRVYSCPFGSSYLAAIMLDRFGHMDLDRLSLVELEQIRNTLSARVSSRRRNEPSNVPF